MEHVFNKTNHVALWNWLSKHPYKWKDEWPGWVSNGGNVKKNDNLCFACDYAGVNCKKCPLVWPSSTRPCNYSILFHRWQQTEDLNMRSEAAVIIRDLPVRKGVKCI